VDHEHSKINVLPLWIGVAHTAIPNLCETAPAVVQNLDAGYFGAGIYLTPQAKYAVKYAAEGLGEVPVPNENGEYAVLLCWTAVGNIYPITRSDYITENCKLLGVPILKGFDGHCACVDPRHKYQATYQINKKCFDEVVVRESNQVLPAFVVYFKKRQ